MPSSRTLTVGVYGATGQVGTVMRSMLAERGFPYDRLRLFASSRSAGTSLDGVEVEDVATADHVGVDVALFSMGAAASRQYAEPVAAAGAVVIDNSSAWRMDDQVPLVVAGVNDVDLERRPKGIVGNPNCTTMICMPPLRALHAAAGLRGLFASTYQAVSGAGGAGVAELSGQVEAIGDKAAELAFDGHSLQFPGPSKFPGPIAFNVLPHAGDFVDEETEEEHKLRNESRKILGIPDLPVSVTCVRVPVFTGHSIALSARLSRPVSKEEATRALSDAPGLRLVDVPTPQDATGSDSVLVGRVRVDRGDPSGNSIAMFVAGDNLRKGAALNAVQIAEALLRADFLESC